MGDETKHKGTTKGHGGLAVCDCYGDEELVGDEQSGDEELRVGENGHRISHRWRWDENPLGRLSRCWLHVEEDGS